MLINKFTQFAFILYKKPILKMALFYIHCLPTIQVLLTSVKKQEKKTIFVVDNNMLFYYVLTIQ